MGKGSLRLKQEEREKRENEREGETEREREREMLPRRAGCRPLPLARGAGRSYCHRCMQHEQTTQRVGAEGRGDEHRLPRTKSC